MGFKSNLTKLNLTGLTFVVITSVIRNTKKVSNRKESKTVVSYDRFITNNILFVIKIGKEIYMKNKIEKISRRLFFFVKSNFRIGILNTSSY